ncbi:MAG: Hint domain-containing protein [Pseudomonadota bacterium]
MRQRRMRDIICFCQGTRIATPGGAVPVGQLRQGDLVLTRDNGPQPVLWRASSAVRGQGAAAPVTIRAGMLGAERDLMVSAAHRILLDHDGVAERFDEPEILFPAKGLIDDDVIFQREVSEVRYYHLLLERHEVLRANGVWCESLRLGDHLPETMGPLALRDFRRTVGIDMPGKPVFEGARRLVKIGGGRGVRRLYGLGPPNEGLKLRVAS